ncbi:S-layer homology domain-containing protein [Bhargavaea ginsengi]|uniref:S-layer homology domain-containing protein n=1 Tax=Bhargavaea ginsengi TaxID=426757 RepID=UPI00203F1026|nr:S-layer homology domain-containing protein [Bhargavaea ginsengi]MCM3087993.1 S-layer homology domain-containing protein [Bhargavaea ginsengi]
MKTFYKWGLAAIMAAGMFLPSGAFAGSYTDLAENDAHYDNILTAQELGILTGYPDGTFQSSKKLQRANVIKALGKFQLKLAKKHLTLIYLPK